MPLLDVTLAAGLRPETKEELRAALCGDMAALIGIDPRFIAVLFKELPPGDMSEQGSFTEVYLSVGRPLAFKEALVKFVAEDINRVTAGPPARQTYSYMTFSTAALPPAARYSIGAEQRRKPQ